MQRQLGNAVPSLIAEILGPINSCAAPRQPDQNAAQATSPTQKGCPAPEKVARLPAKYQRYIGDHEAHPGEGKGCMAMRGAK
jgi:DNA (cytosine-5)-methyltransferase 1